MIESGKSEHFRHIEEDCPEATMWQDQGVMTVTNAEAALLEANRGEKMPFTH